MSTVSSRLAGYHQSSSFARRGDDDTLIVRTFAPATTRSSRSCRRAKMAHLTSALAGLSCSTTSTTTTNTSGRRSTMIWEGRSRVWSCAWCTAARTSTGSRRRQTAPWRSHVSLPTRDKAGDHEDSNATTARNIYGETSAAMGECCNLVYKESVCWGLERTTITTHEVMSTGADDESLACGLGTQCEKAGTTAVVAELHCPFISVCWRSWGQPNTSRSVMGDATKIKDHHFLYTPSVFYN